MPVSRRRDTSAARAEARLPRAVRLRLMLAGRSDGRRGLPEVSDDTVSLSPVLDGLARQHDRVLARSVDEQPAADADVERDELRSAQQRRWISSVRVAFRGPYVPRVAELAIDAGATERHDGLDLVIGARRWRLRSGRTLSVGRAIDCDIRVDDQEVSRRHAEVLLDARDGWL